MKNNKLQLAQLDQKLAHYESADHVIRPAIGWVKTIRTSIGMSLEQLGDKLGITRQSAQHLEKREAEGGITLNALEEAAKALDMKFVYGFVPLDGSIEKLIERKAKELATEIVMRTSATMKLEGQENTPERLKQAIEDRTQELVATKPKILWR